MKKLLVVSFLVAAMVLLVNFSILPIGRTSPGIYTCKIKPETKTHQGWGPEGNKFTAYCPKEADGGCECAENDCTDLCAGDICDWEQGVFVSPTVCSTPEMMPHCTGVLLCPT